VARAWDFRKPLLVAPAMNTAMYEHPITAQQLGTLTGWGITVIPSISKILACGDVGYGAMAEWESIVQATAKVLP
jgi:phosphopantothenoylcysteine decarboxylase